ncbi:hypothetical protein BC332_21165 [Capsicum chinense]|nr:hypothetical protein BC332_21165 [Capsicum chinense]
MAPQLVSFHLRGWRQGDPLSPFLFSLAMGGLCDMLKTVQSNNCIRSFKLNENDPLSLSISHLQYLDDTLVFCGADEDQLKYLRSFSSVLKLFQDYILTGERGLFTLQAVLTQDNLKKRFCESETETRNHLFYIARFFSPKPMFEYILSGEFYRCILTLPPNAAFQTVVGPEGRSTQLSRQLVCLDACKKLHQLGALNDHLLPFNEKPSQSDSVVQDKKSGAALIDNVLDATRTYMMFLFPIPKSVIEGLDVLRRNFLWQGNSDSSSFVLQESITSVATNVASNDEKDNSGQKRNGMDLPDSQRSFPRQQKSGEKMEDYRQRVEFYDTRKYNVHGRYMSFVSLTGEFREVIIVPEIAINAGWSDIALKIDNFINNSMQQRFKQPLKQTIPYAKVVERSKWQQQHPKVSQLDGKGLLGRRSIIGFFERSETPTPADVKRWATLTWKKAFGVNVYEMIGHLFLFEFPNRHIAEQYCKENRFGETIRPN